jgi:hypothetical protein
LDTRRTCAAGKDKSLVFPDWLRPTREDRTLVYDKGAYILHLLRDEMGDRAFWIGGTLESQLLLQTSSPQWNKQTERV